MTIKFFLEGRIHILKVTILDTKITLLNIYGPNHETDRGPFLNKLRDILNTYDYGDTVILGGDFNFVPDYKVDNYPKGKNMNSFEASKAQIELESFKKYFNLTDIWRDRNTTKRKYNWSQPNPSSEM